MRCLLVTLEYNYECFSGNGTLSQALVRGITTRSTSPEEAIVDRDGAEVLVVCAKPTAAVAAERATLDSNGDVPVLYVDVPSEKWFDLSLNGAWREFAKACEREDVRAQAQIWAPSCVLGVDWSSKAAAEALRLSAPYVMTTFRVFSKSDQRHAPYEREAVAMASGVIALCRSDALYIMECLGATRMPAIICPPLRSNVVEIAKELGHSMEKRQRRYLACVVRVSQEKEPDRFVNLVEELARRGVFKSGALIPLMCANASILSTSKYAQDLKARFLRCAPNGRVVEDFLNERQLGEIFCETVLNVHPPAADAFGMTIIEAAAFGVPSVMHRGGTVGASDLLRPGIESLEVDVLAPVPDFANRIEQVLADPNTLVIAKRAAARALEWDEAAYGRAMLEQLLTY